MDSRASLGSCYSCTVQDTCSKEMKRQLTAATRRAADNKASYKEEIIWDIYGKRTCDILEKGTADATDSDDFHAKLL